MKLVLFVLLVCGIILSKSNVSWSAMATPSSVISTTEGALVSTLYPTLSSAMTTRLRQHPEMAEQVMMAREDARAFLLGEHPEMSPLLAQAVEQLRTRLADLPVLGGMLGQASDVEIVSAIVGYGD